MGYALTTSCIPRLGIGQVVQRSFGAPVFRLQNFQKRKAFDQYEQSRYTRRHLAQPTLDDPWGAQTDEGLPRSNERAASTELENDCIWMKLAGLD